MTSEREDLGSHEAREAVINAYNYIFYGIDSDLIALWPGFNSFDKRQIVKKNNQLARIFSEGAPCVFPLGHAWISHAVVPEPTHTGPAGYEIYISQLRNVKRRGLIGDSQKFTLYHDGSGFTQDVQISLKPFLKIQEELEMDIPLNDSDLISLKFMLKIIQETHKIANPYEFKDCIKNGLVKI